MLIQKGVFQIAILPETHTWSPTYWKNKVWWKEIKIKTVKVIFHSENMWLMNPISE